MPKISAGGGYFLVPLRILAARPDNERGALADRCVYFRRWQKTPVALYALDILVHPLVRPLVLLRELRVGPVAVDPDGDADRQRHYRRRLRLHVFVSQHGLGRR
jgi:hypothetical protein